MATAKIKKTTTAKKTKAKKCARPATSTAKKSVKAAPAKKAAAKKATVKKATVKKTAVKKTAAKAAPKKTTRAKKGTSKNAFKKEMRAKLMETKKYLLSEINMKIKNESDTHKKEIGDIYDIASSERERELTLMLGDRDRAKIQELDCALEWLEEDEYGLCEECGEPVGDNRMRALPFTRVCIECKSKFEKNSLHKGRLEDGPHGINDKTDSTDGDF